MSLYQRLHETPADAPSGPGRDPLLDELRQRVHHLLIDELGPLLYDRRVGEEELSLQLQEQLKAILGRERIPLSGSDRAQLLQDVTDDILGYGPIDGLLKDPDVTEVMVNGGTGTGKTTALNVLSSFIPADERVVTIEDAKELQLRQDHVLALEARPPNVEGKGEVRIRDLVRNALRMRPDRIVVGECRGGEALDMLQAMNTGHDGSLTTVPANSPRDSLSRIEAMV